MGGGTDARRWERVNELFARALDLPAAERTEFLAAECGGDDSLFAELRSLIAGATSANAKLRAIVAGEIAVESSEPRGAVVGQLIGERFALEREVGSGGMGTVYRAIDRTSERPVAIKLLGPRLGRDAEERFDREANVLAGLQHPGIVGYVAHGRDDHGPFLAMEWLDGEDLAARLARKTLTVAESVSLTRQVAAALSHAHDHGVVHRDIKPSNLWLVGGDPVAVKVLDFGIARARGAVSLTGTRAIIGTVGYMAPEQASGERDVDAKADLFSLGCVLYECLTATPAFTGDHVVAILVKLLHDMPRPVRELRPELPAALEGLVGRMLAKERAQRPADAAAVASELDAFAGVDAPAPVPGSQPAAEPPASSGELRILQLLLVDPRDDLAIAETVRGHRLANVAQADAEESPIERALAPFGAAVTPLRNGMWFAQFPERGAARDRAEAAGAAACAIIAAMPRARVAIANGRGVPGHGLPGNVIDRCAAVLAAVADGQIGSDETSARLLEERYVVEGKLLVRQRTAPAGERLLLGKATPCVGRSKELALLGAMIDDAIDESVARSVIVTAGAGAGKSRLARELLAQSRSLRVIAVRGDAVEADSNIAMLRQLVRRIAGLEADDDARACKVALHAILDGATPDPVRACEFLIADVLGRSLPSPAQTPEFRASRNDPAERAAWLERAILELVDAFSRRGPLLLVLDDLHWAGATTIAYVGEVLRRLHDRPLFVLGLARPEVDALLAKPWPASQRIALDPLTRRAARELVGAALGQTIGEADLAPLVDRAQGNAFYLEELVRAYAAGRHELPETVQAMVEARLQSEDVDARQAIRSASVFGERCSVAAIAMLLNRSEEVVRQILERLARAELLDRDRDERNVFAFRHAIVRDVAYAMIPPGDRAELHRRTVQWLEDHGETDPLLLAGHHEQAGNRSAVADCLTRAVEQMYALGQMRRTLELAAKATAIEGLTDPQWSRVEIARCGALVHLGRPTDAFTAAVAAVRRAPRGSHPYVRGIGIQSVLLWLGGKTTEAVEATRLFAVEPFQATSLLGPSVWSAALAAMLTGQRALMSAISERAERSLAALAPDPGFAAYACIIMALTAVNTMGPPARALRLVEDTDAILAHVGSPQAHAWCEWARAWVLWNCGQDDRALASVKRVFEEPTWREFSLVRLTTFGLIGYFGRVDPGSGAAIAAMAATPGIHSLLLGGEAHARFVAGDQAAAEQMATYLWDHPQLLPWGVAGAATILARIALARGAADRALDLARRAVEVAGVGCCPLRHAADAWACLGDVHEARDDHDRAAQVRDDARARLVALASNLDPAGRATFFAADSYRRLLDPR